MAPGAMPWIPVHHEENLGPDQNGLGIKFTVNHCLRRGQQRSEPCVPGLAELFQPREARSSGLANLNVR